MNMKKLALLILSIAVSALILGCSEADTINPEGIDWGHTDETENAPIPSSMTVTSVSTPTALYPFIKITFNTPANISSIKYNVSLKVFDHGTDSLIPFNSDPLIPISGQYTANPQQSIDDDVVDHIDINLSKISPPVTIRIELDNIQSYRNPSLYLYHQEFIITPLP